ncbi:MAG: HAD family hydrolase [Actinomycetota bacterium]|nr:HAD family hydrolase [Actinomycetota bacterium]MDP9475504.1 HAD family hydrolase [Actinomycetota bacterium]
MKKKWLIWDFDGTLAYRVGEWPAWTQALLEVLDREIPGHGVDPDLFRPYLRTGFPWHSPEAHHPHLSSADAWWGALEPRFADAFRAAGAEEAGASKMAKAVRRAYLDPGRWRLYEDAVPALEGLSSSGWKHALLTNHVPELPEIAGRLGLDLHVDRIFNSARTGYEKPHPEAFRGVLEALGGTEEVWMIGDNADADVAGAKAAGIPAVLVRKRRYGVEPYCEDLTGIAAIVEG